MTSLINHLRKLDKFESGYFGQKLIQEVILMVKELKRKII